jgi:hypothetical protein
LLYHFLLAVRSKVDISDQPRPVLYGFHSYKHFLPDSYGSIKSDTIGVPDLQLTMSASTVPISSARFAAALVDLPLSSLHAKAAELRNSNAHLQYSNEQLQEFAEEGDRDCIEAIQENNEVMKRNEERIELLKKEIEGRGFKWDEGVKLVNGEGGRDDGDVDMGDGEEEEDNDDGAEGVGRAGEGARGGRLGDEELARRLRERMAEDQDSDDGVHL